MMRTLLTKIGSLGLATFALLASATLSYGVETPNHWLPADDFYTDSNKTAWDFFEVPDYDFDEVAVVTTNVNAVTPVARINSLLSTSPGAVYLGELSGERGALRIENGGTLTLAHKPGNETLGGVNVGRGGVGFLDVLPGGTLDAGYLTLGGDGGSVATLGGNSGGSTSVTIAGGGGSSAGTVGTTVGDSNTLRIVGPNVDYSTTSFSMAGASTLAAGITGATHSVVKSTSTVGLNGTLLLEFDGVSPTVGDSWDLFDAPGVNGAFSSIQATGAMLSLGQSFLFDAVEDASSTHGVVGRVTVEQRLVLSVNRQSGAVSIMGGPSPVAFDGYSISSGGGALDPSSWNSLDEQGVSDWRESPAGGGGTRLSELKPTASTAVSGNSSLSLGNIFDYAAPTEFGVETEDLAFEYYTESGEKVQGVILYEGVKFNNNLLLVVDPSDGKAQLVNDSPFDISLDGYWIASESGSLQSGGWDSLGTEWTKANPTANNLVELQADGATLLAAGARYNLGTLFDTSGEKDLVLQYLFPEDETFSRIGAVDYRAVVDSNMGDYNGDGAVDAADYAVWRNTLNASVTPGTGADGNGDGFVNQGDYTVWRLNYGQVLNGASASAVAQAPEPAGGVLMFCVASSIAVACGRRAKR